MVLFFSLCIVWAGSDGAEFFSWAKFIRRIGRKFAKSWQHWYGFVFSLCIVWAASDGAEFFSWAKFIRRMSRKICQELATLFSPFLVWAGSDGGEHDLRRFAGGQEEDDPQDQDPLRLWSVLSEQQVQRNQNKHQNIPSGRLSFLVFLKIICWWDTVYLYYIIYLSITWGFTKTSKKMTWKFKFERVPS